MSTPSQSPKGTILITLSEDPAQPLKAVYTGNWTPHEIHAAAALVPKGYRQLLSDIRRQEERERNKEKGE